MNQIEFKSLARRSGFRVELSEKYGNYQWQRAFIKKNGISHGRAVFYQNELYSTKIYGGAAFEVFCLEMLIEYDYLPTIEEYNLTWYWAEKEANLKHEQKVNLRKSMPYKKRRALTPPNAGHFFNRIFVYKWITFRGVA